MVDGLMGSRRIVFVLLGFVAMTVGGAVVAGVPVLRSALIGQVLEWRSDVVLEKSIWEIDRRVGEMKTASPTPVGGRKLAAFFPIGVFEDAPLVQGNPMKFEAMLKDMAAHGLDSVIFTNNRLDRDAPLLDVSDRLGANVFFSLPADELYRNWWPDNVPADAQTARRVAQPGVTAVRNHPSLKGYVVEDEPGLSHLAKLAVLTQMLRELDPGRLVMSILIGLDRVPPFVATSQPDVVVIDAYPIGSGNPVCDFRMTGFGYDHLDFAQYVRRVTVNKPAGTPLWMILQTHGFAPDGRPALRQPVPEEVRAENWMAIGEGATGIFWFIYSSEQGWTGLADNPALYNEVASLAGRVRPLGGLLLGLRKINNEFKIAGPGHPYASTLSSQDGTKFYVVGVNRDCADSQQLAITSSQFRGRLRDLESGEIVALGEPMKFGPGDGRIFELVGNEAGQ